MASQSLFEHWADHIINNVMTRSEGQRRDAVVGILKQFYKNGEIDTLDVMRHRFSHAFARVADDTIKQWEETVKAKDTHKPW